MSNTILLYMKSIHSLFIVFCLIIMSAPAYAIERHNGYCSTAQTTADIMQCLSAHEKAEQTKMEDIFAKIAVIYDDQSEKIEILKSNQAQWLEYRNDICAIEGRLFEGGSLQRVQELDCYARLSKERNSHLMTILDAQDNTIIPEYSNPPRWVNVLVRDYPEKFWGFGSAQAIDTDCDGKNENIVRALTMDGKMTLAIADSMATGRPKISIVNFDDKNECQIVSDYKVVKLPEIKPVENMIQSCSQYVEIQTKNCGDFSLSYDLSQQQYTITKQD